MTTDLDKLLADAAGSAKRAAGWAIVLDNSAYLDPEDMHGIARDFRGCVRDLGAMAREIGRFREEFERLTRERDATVGAFDRLRAEFALLLSESPPRVVPCVDHPVLDVIARAITPQFQHLGPDCIGPAEEVTRESECVEFRDADGRRFEIIVRPIPDAEDRP